MRAKARIKHDVDLLREDTSKLITDLGNLTRALQETSFLRSKTAVETLNRQLDHNRQSLRDGLQRFSGQCQSQAKSIDQNIRARPYLYILSSFGLGYLTAKLTRKG